MCRRVAVLTVKLVFDGCSSCKEVHRARCLQAYLNTIPSYTHQADYVSGHHPTYRFIQLDLGIWPHSAPQAKIDEWVKIYQHHHAVDVESSDSGGREPDDLGALLEYVVKVLSDFEQCTSPVGVRA